MRHTGAEGIQTLFYNSTGKRHKQDLKLEIYSIFRDPCVGRKHPPSQGFNDDTKVKLQFSR